MAGFQWQMDKLVGLSESELIYTIGEPDYKEMDDNDIASIYLYQYLYGFSHCNAYFLIKNKVVVSYKFEGGECLDYENKEATHPILKQQEHPIYYTPTNRVPKEQNNSISLPSF